MTLRDPADKTLDAAADGAFGGKTNRRAGYSKTVTFEGREYTEIEWIKRTAMRDGTLASSEGRKLIEHYERILDRLRNPSAAVMIAAEDAMDAASACDCVPGDWNTAWVLAAIHAAVAAAEQEANA